MYLLVIARLLMIVSDFVVLADISQHYFVNKRVANKAQCNWRIQISCKNSSVIDILEVIVSNTSCNGGSCPCVGPNGGDTSTDHGISSIPDYVKDECKNQTNCNSSLPHPGTSGNNDMTNVTVLYKCSGSSTTTTTGPINDNTSQKTLQSTSTETGRTEWYNSTPITYSISQETSFELTDTSTFPTPTLFTDGLSSFPGDITSRSATMTAVSSTTNSVDSSQRTLASSLNTGSTSTSKAAIDSTMTVYETTITSSESYSATVPFTETTSSITSLKPVSISTNYTYNSENAFTKQSSNKTAALATVLILLVLVGGTVGTIIILKRKKRSRLWTDDKIVTGTGSDEGHQDGIYPGPVVFMPMNEVADNSDYNTINLRTFMVTEDPTYNHVNTSFCGRMIDDLQYSTTNVSPLIDFDYASCADIDETPKVDDTYLHIKNNTNSKLIPSTGTAVKAVHSDYDHIDLECLNDNHVNSSTTEDNAYFHTGPQTVLKSLADMNQNEDSYSHIGQVLQQSLTAISHVPSGVDIASNAQFKESYEYATVKKVKREIKSDSSQTGNPHCTED